MWFSTGKCPGSLVLAITMTAAMGTVLSCSTAPSDLARLYMEVLHPAIGSPDAPEKMLSRSILVNERTSWGLGIGIQATSREDDIWQWGNNGGIFHALAVAGRNSRTGVIVMVSGRGGAAALREIAHAAIGGEHYSYQFGL